MSNFTWVNGTDGLWDTAGNWAGGTVANGTLANVTIVNGVAEILSGETYSVDLVTLSSGAATLMVEGLLNLLQGEFA